jgi:hypothetical protein
VARTRRPRKPRSDPARSSRPAALEGGDARIIRQRQYTRTRRGLARHAMNKRRENGGPPSLSSSPVSSTSTACPISFRSILLVLRALRGDVAAPRVALAQRDRDHGRLEILADTRDVSRITIRAAGGGPGCVAGPDQVQIAQRVQRSRSRNFQGRDSHGQAGSAVRRSELAESARCR